MPKRQKVKNKKLFREKRSWLFFKIIVLIVLACVLFGLILFIWFIRDLPRPERFTEGDIIQSTKIYDRTGQIVLYEIFGEEKRTFVSLEEIPDFLRLAVVATQDKNFFEHQGLDFKRLVKAVLYDLRIRKPAQGASTITQQLIRSYFLTRKKTLERKTREIVLSLEIERRYSKDQILEWYLNLIPFGSNIYGVEEASQTFFNKHISDISLAEAASLAAIIQAPSYYWPHGEHKQDLLDRKDYVLDRMVKLGRLSQEQADQAKQQELVFEKKVSLIEAPHFVFFVKDYLEDKYGPDFLIRKGLKVYTTLDYDLQKTAEAIIKQETERVQAYNAYNGALVSINPKTGEILAMVGSKDYFGEPQPKGCIAGVDCWFDPQVNVALSLRQPGSSIKPFIYSKAFEYLTPNTLVWDVKTEFNLNCPVSADQEIGQYNSKCYHPKNYDGRFLGPISLRSALAQSRNLPSVKVLYLAGLNKVLDFIQDFGISTLKEKNRYGLSLVLGGGEVRLLEMVEGYGVFANDGIKPSLSFIKKIEDFNGRIIEQSKLSQTRIISSQIAREINDILSDNTARAPMFGLNSFLKLANYPAAAKTGTTQNYRDAWIVGYSPNLVAGVWVGNNDNSPMLKMPAVSLTGPIWNNFMEKALTGFPKQEFIEPEQRKTGQPILDGVLPGNHSILHYLDRSDSQYSHWETAVQTWLNNH